MEKTVLIVADDSKTREAIRGTLLNLGRGAVDCFSTTYATAFSALAKRNPSIVIVCDYTTKGSLAKSFQTYNDLKKHAKTWQVVVRVGKDAIHGADYIRHPSGDVPIAKAEETFRAQLRSLLAA
ncbi:MAG: hypothetical protein NUV61_02465 [Candidatus Azambacteria bacterium]|nr:hypothetical protein [Candidatus Azambacteria bacterium]